MYRCQKISFQQFILCNDILRTVVVMRFYITNKVQINFIIFPRMKLTMMFLFAYKLCEIIPVYVPNKRNTKSILKLVHIFTRKNLVTQKFCFYLATYFSYKLTHLICRNYVCLGFTSCLKYFNNYVIIDVEECMAGIYGLKARDRLALSRGVVFLAF